MANVKLNSLTFEGLTDTYKINQIAAAFSTSASYAVGDYCDYQGQIYRCTTAHSGAWNAAHFTAVYIADEIALNDVYYLLTTENIPGETQTVNYDSTGTLSTITHVVSGTTIRTDAFTFDADSVTEVRTLNSGQVLTLVTDLDTLVTTTTYTT